MPELDEVSFFYGNLAPDSGLPNEDWTVFEPPRKVTHYLDEDSHVFTDLIFYSDFIRGLDKIGRKLDFSFRLGYYIHLLTDQFWWRKIIRTTETSNQEIFSTKTRGEAFDLIKTDWYDLDHKYLRDHPCYIVWQKFFESAIPKISLPFLPQKAFVSQMKYIKGYYTTPDPDRVLDRRYPYLNEKILNLFISETSIAIIRLIHLLECNPQVEFTSSLSLLSPEESASYYPPLGD
ncbi:MAG: hypothetical protein CVU45_00420 [Chloroflexi bacterium HGW-Chloroflexi-7]|nr:MAG: hypothetical protein CVU45_00420 [Chloroflexi bacterium HGW-Chloroflexi-7]